MPPVTNALPSTLPEDARPAPRKPFADFGFGDSAGCDDFYVEACDAVAPKEAQAA